MRLIVYHGVFDLPKCLQVPDETFAFVCFEDFSVGPLGDFGNLAKFTKAREAFWQKSPSSNLPDGSKMHYSVWFQTLPSVDLVEMVQSGVDIESIPFPHEFEDVASEATTIEIWRDQTVNGEVFQWYLSAILPIMGVDQDNVSVCLFTEDYSSKKPNKFWSDMFLDTPERCIPAVSPSASDWQHMLRCWEAMTNLPQPIDHSLTEKSDEHTLHAFEVLRGRHPDAVTGLTNIQTRFLQSTPADWRKALRVVSDAMCAGLDANDPVQVSTLEAILDEMVQMASPLIEKRGVGPMHKSEVRLTLQGQKNST